MTRGSSSVPVATVAIWGSSEHTASEFYKSICGKAAQDDGGDCALFCETCKLWIEGDFGMHKTSVGHLHALNKASSIQHNVHIPESNKGYSMLKKMGWDEISGLGKDKQGPVAPVATQFRTDRSGLGEKKIPRRVTHFESKHEGPKSDDEDDATEGPSPAPAGPTPASLRPRQQTRKQERKAREKRINILEKARDELYNRIFNMDSSVPIG